MVVSCVAENCSNCFKKLLKLNDKNREICEQWLANVKHHGPLLKENHFILCSNHFEKSCFERDFKILRFQFI